jgi:hypothetical protein
VACVGFGVTGNFVIDPDWDEDDFKRLWAFVEDTACNAPGHHPHTLPGTPYDRFATGSARPSGRSST